MDVGTVSHWTLLVTDLGRSSRFYTDVMGWRPVKTGRAEGAIRFVRDGQRIELLTHPGVGPPPVPPAANHLGLSHMTVATDPAAAVIEALEQRGVAVRRHTLDSFIEDPNDPSPTQFLFEDPDGNLIETFAATGEDWSPFGSVGGSDAETSATGVRHLSHWSLCVANPERSLPFYREVLGWQELGLMEWAGEGPSRVMDVGPARLTTWLLAAGDQRVEIIHFDHPGVTRRPGAGTEGPGLSSITVRVRELEAEADRLMASGVATTMDRTGKNGPVLQARDPDGNLVRFIAQELDWTTD